MSFRTKKIIKIEDAIIEAKRFINRANKWKKILTKDEMAIYCSKEGGACKRASLDLTRSLAELRKP